MSSRACRRLSTFVVVALVAVGCAGTSRAEPATPRTSGAAASSLAPTGSPSTPAFPAAPTAPPSLAPELLTPIQRTVPAHGSLDVPLDLEHTSRAQIAVIASTDALSARIGATQLAASDTVLGWSLTVALDAPENVTLTLSNKGDTAADAQILPTILTDRHVLIATSASWVPVGGSVSFTVRLTNADTEDAPVFRISSRTGTAGTQAAVVSKRTGADTWSGSVTFPDAGSWGLVAQVAGDHPRNAVAEISVSPGYARIGDGFTERLDDTDGDTLADALVLAPDVVVTKDGSYHVNARLVTADGQDVTNAGVTVRLGVGSHHVELVFDGGRIHDRGLAGPYHLVDVVVFDEDAPSSLGPQDRRDDLGPTKPYAVDQFQHPPVVFDRDSFKVRSVDADGDGRFESIRLTGRVTVALAGRFDLGAQLLARDGTLNGAGLDYASVGRLELEPGTSDFELVFDGGRIRASGLDGPYEIRRPTLILRSDTRVQGSGPTTFTPPWRARQFEAGPSDPDATQPPLSDDPSDAP